MKIPFLLQLIGLVVLTFIPGFAILRALRIYHLHITENIIFTVALSIFFVMAFGFIGNIILAIIGIHKPLSAIPIFLFYNISICILLSVVYYQKEPSVLSESIEVTFTPFFLVTLLLPFLSLFGAYLMNYNGNNILNIILFLIISIIPFLVILLKIDERLYPLIIFSVSFSILYNVDLISNYIWGYDSFYLLYGANKSIFDGLWNMTDSMILPLLFSSILLPIYSLLCDLEMVWVFKLVNPFLFSLVPVVLYLIYKKTYLPNMRFDSSITFLASFVFIFYYGFFKDFPNKQHVAELFLVLILLLSVTSFKNKRIMLLLFTFSLITIHYAISYLFLISIIILYFLKIIISNHHPNAKNSIYSLNFVLIFLVLSISWYQFAAQGDIFHNFIVVIYTLFQSLSDIFLIDSRSGISYALYESTSNWWAIFKLTHISLQILIFIGMVQLFILMMRNKLFSRENDIFIFTFVFYAYLLLQVIKSSGMGFDRILQISLIFLSPISFLGLMSLLEVLQLAGRKLIKQNIVVTKENISMIPHYSKYVFSIFLMIFFIFNSGVIFELANDYVPPYSVSLAKDASWNVYFDSEISTIEWIKMNSGNHKIAFFNEWHNVIKSRDGLILHGTYSPEKLMFMSPNTQRINDAYIYLGHFSKDKMTYDNQDIRTEETILYQDVLQKSNKIYSSGNSVVYLPSSD
ncbi:DUF2206 domain-containing protein [Methanolobus sp.]|uniref:DUF2206 domain-containing protein n=1 Tax=Methanolobus sp. TaxID=1874737 RepID=UPI0025CC4A73|nr:DUF2206 domain-containing protein [Methanolobus sp.]